MARHDISVRIVSEEEGQIRLAVQVQEAKPGSGETHHEVTLARQLLERLAPGEAPEGFVRRCFQFLLEREPKESILGRFDASVIGRYFPEFEKTVARRS